MSKVTLTNMVMIRDKTTGKVLVQDRIKSWKGLSFPGGHVENDESFVDSAIREVREETGLVVKNLEYCGVIHWLNTKTFERYIVFLYKTEDFSGVLKEESDEGKNLWITIDELRNTPSENGMPLYLPVFLEDKYSEAFGPWNDEEALRIEYK
ncbi:MAG: 8-oxo-dGTP diphosphatase [Clostridia bacterium]|jgi:8-oxo-dGTP diphosphatase|nr:8-oxo-dGTP diphosphatase [Clostridiaceae bacterium]